METIFTKINRKMQTKEVLSTFAGFIVGLAKLMITNEAFSAIVLAFVTGAAAWLGQTIAKAIWSFCGPKINKFLKP